MRCRIASLFALLAGVLSMPRLAVALPLDTTGWDCVTDNSAASCNTAATNAHTTVTAWDADTMRFFLTYAGTPGSITDVYISGPAFLALEAIQNLAGVAFSSPATPANLPGGQNATPPFVAVVSADSDPPVAANGVENGDGGLGLLVTLAQGVTLAQAEACLLSGSCAVGIHVQALQAGQSEGLTSHFGDNPVPPREVSEPKHYSLVLLGLGFAGLMIVRRKKGRRNHNA